MFNPSELEGEVDHAFFDSDCDSSSRHERKKVEKGLKAEKESPAAPEWSNAMCSATAKDDLSPSYAKSGRHLNGVKNNNNSSSSRARIKESSKQASVSASCTSHKVGTDSSDSDEDFGRPKVSLLALLAETRDVEDKDVSSKSTDETEEEAGTFSDSSKRRKKHSLKKRARSRHTQNSSRSSTENSADADLDSSCSSNSRKSSLEFPTLPKASKASLCPEVRRTRVGSAVSQQGQTIPTDESDYSVTDVSPLASPQCSPRQSLDPHHGEAEESLQEEQREENVPSSGLSNIHGEESDHDMDECSFSLESQLRDKLVIDYPGGRNRKNYSFSNDEVRRIDQENQRLLRELSRLSPGPQSRSAMTKKSQVASPSPLVHHSHSALNRQRDQQRIDRENLAFLKRLESVKPTPGLGRSGQLADYRRHARYMGAPSYPICMSTVRSRSSTSSGPRPVGSRAASTASDCSATPAPRPKKLSAVRPAWC